ncbi:hypothetical protein DB346_12040 [Verrucomicrobia bacterium LW23]|nr:hypothetical protein DB346_12040 [Verrucomicrobia bacterium LW23]
MKVEILVTPKKSVFDPQGDAVLRCLHTQGLEKAVSVRIGKYIELEVDAAEGEVSGARLEEICRDILSNPVIEDYALRLVAPAPAATKPKAKKEAVAAPAQVADAVVAPEKKARKVPLKPVNAKPAKSFAFAKSKATIGKVLPLKDATSKLKAKKKAS